MFSFARKLAPFQDPCTATSSIIIGSTRPHASFNNGWHRSRVSNRFHTPPRPLACLSGFLLRQQRKTLTVTLFAETTSKMTKVEKYNSQLRHIVSVRRPSPPRSLALSLKLNELLLFRKLLLTVTGGCKHVPLKEREEHTEILNGRTWPPGWMQALNN